MGWSKQPLHYKGISKAISKEQTTWVHKLKDRSKRDGSHKILLRNEERN